MATADNSQNQEHRLRAVLNALGSQDDALSELTDVIGRQGDAIGGVVLFLRALVDVLLDNEQRAMLVSHLEMSTGGTGPQAGREVVDTVLS